MIAYSLRKPESQNLTAVRVRHARDHLQSVHRASLVETRVGDQTSGLVGWHSSGRKIDWSVHTRRENAMTTWIHVPAVAGGPETNADEWELATNVLDGTMDPAALGAPFAVARWSHGELRLANDIFGLVRLFHYEFEDGDVWSTRQGLAHVFMGVTPVKNRSAWAGVAAMGWAAGGATHMGAGRQMPGGSRVVAGRNGGERRVSITSGLGDWLERARSAPLPSVHRNVADMELVMSTAKRWPGTATADLSGGKDSRVGAALGIKSQAISAVRTINTDPGEVEIARSLMAAIETPIPHRITERQKHDAAVNESFQTRLLAQNQAFEGRQLFATAYNSPLFEGFRDSPRARFNGLGGEVLAGGNFQTGKWRAKVVGAPTGTARDRLVNMSRLGLASSSSSMDRVVEIADSFVRDADILGARSGGEVLDLFYALDKMPNWSGTFASDANICPLFAPSALSTAVHSMGAAREPGAVHRELVAAAIPEWSDIPFYKPSFATRTTAPVWARKEWRDVEDHLIQQLEFSESYDPTAFYQLLREIDHGEGKRTHEFAIYAFLWELSFDDYLALLTVETERVAQELFEQRSLDCTRKNG